MSLDVYVMPLWRFKVDDFVTPIETALGQKPIVIAGEEERPPPLPWYVRLLAKIGVLEVGPEHLPPPNMRRLLAVRQVWALKRKLTRLTGTAVDWPDKGEVQYSSQFFHPVTLRAFAAWIDHRDKLPEFLEAPERDYYRHAVWQLEKPSRPRYPTLIDHSLHTGYFVPVPFEGLHLVEPFSAWGREFHHHVASTQTISRELEGLLHELESFPPAVKADHSTPVGAAHWYAQELRRICDISLAHRLPVIFHG
jgi:hypothetical protein